MQTISDGIFYRFGVRSLIIKIFKNLLVSALFFGIAVFLVYTKNNEIWAQVNSLQFPGNPLSQWILEIAFGVAIISVPIQIISALISYVTTQFMISNTTLSRKSGFFVKREESFPLRYINNVSSNQNIMDQIFGVGTCAIEMVSDEKDASHADKVSLDDLDKEKMLELKDILLARTNVQQVTIAPG